MGYWPCRESNGLLKVAFEIWIALAAFKARKEFIGKLAKFFLILVVFNQVLPIGAIQASLHLGIHRAFAFLVLAAHSVQLIAEGVFENELFDGFFGAARD